MAYIYDIYGLQGFPGITAVRNLPANAGHAGSIPGSGKSTGEGNGNPSSVLF